MQFDLLRRVVIALEPRKDWASSDANLKEFYVAYEAALDAARLMSVVNAKPLVPSLQWLSQAAFHLDKATQQLLTGLLKT
jgi:hypothetical protein